MNAVRHSVPAVTTQLGTVLDCVVRVEGGTLLTIDEWRGWLLLTDENALERQRPKLYLVAPRELNEPAPRKNYEPATATYEGWHKRRGLEVRVYDVPPRFPWLLGRAQRIGYRSDKWRRRGKPVDYEHDFNEGGGVPPLVYLSARGLAQARGAVLVGGSMKVTERGIA